MMKAPTAGSDYGAAILAAGFAAMLALNLPGQMSYDSVSQLFDGRFGTYNSWHPAVMAWLLGLFDAVLPGTGLFVVFEAAMLALAFALSLRRNAGWGAAAGRAWHCADAAIPAVPGHGVEGCAVRRRLCSCLRAAGARGRVSKSRTRLVLLALFFLALSLAALARQNGLVLLPVGAVTFALGDGAKRYPARRGARRSWRWLLLLALVAGADCCSPGAAMMAKACAAKSSWPRFMISPAR